MTPIRMLRTALAAASAMMLLAGTAQAADGMDVASARQSTHKAPRLTIWPAIT